MGIPSYIHVTPSIAKWNEIELSPILESNTDVELKLGQLKIEYPFINW